MAGSVNKVILIGNLGKDPEVRRMQDGRPVVNLSVATSDSWRDKATGERRERTEWHGGVGSSYCWADPETGVSFAYLTNSRVPDPWHSRRLDIISNCVHGAIGDV